MMRTATATTILAATRNSVTPGGRNVRVESDSVEREIVIEFSLEFAQLLISSSTSK